MLLFMSFCLVSITIEVCKPCFLISLTLRTRYLPRTFIFRLVVEGIQNVVNDFRRKICFARSSSSLEPENGRAALLPGDKVLMSEKPLARLRRSLVLQVEV